MIPEEASLLFDKKKAIVDPDKVMSMIEFDLKVLKVSFQAVWVFYYVDCFKYTCHVLMHIYPFLQCCH